MDAAALGLAGDGDQRSGSERPAKRGPVRGGSPEAQERREENGGSSSDRSDRGWPGGPGSGCGVRSGDSEALEKAVRDLRRQQLSLAFAVAGIFILILLEDLEIWDLWAAVGKLRQPVG
jgi:hypothetical protein